MRSQACDSATFNYQCSELLAAVRGFVSFNATLDSARKRETPPFASDAVVSGRFRNAVMQLNHPILEAFDGLQIQGTWR
jgi:hypothetical protein